MADSNIGPSPMRLAEPLACDPRYRVVAYDRITPTIAELLLRPLGKVLDHLPGEYVLVEDDGHLVGPWSYSIANAPRANATISLLVTRAPGGVTSAWANERLHVGDTVRLPGPLRTFVDDPAAATTRAGGPPGTGAEMTPTPPNASPPIYGKTGEDGTTGLLFGGRISKTEPVIEICGTLDEAVAALGHHGG